MLKFHPAKDILSTSLVTFTTVDCQSKEVRVWQEGGSAKVVVVKKDDAF
jgi:hypothetical protein